MLARAIAKGVGVNPREPTPPTQRVHVTRLLPCEKCKKGAYAFPFCKRRKWCKGTMAKRAAPSVATPQHPWAFDRPACGLQCLSSIIKHVVSLFGVGTHHPPNMKTTIQSFEGFARQLLHVLSFCSTFHNMGVNTKQKACAMHQTAAMTWQHPPPPHGDMPILSHGCPFFCRACRRAVAW